MNTVMPFLADGYFAVSGIEPTQPACGMGILIPIMLECGLVGALIGKPKNRTLDGFLLGLLFGPAGYIVLYFVTPKAMPPVSNSVKPVEFSGRQFQIESQPRQVQLLRRGLKMVGIGVATYVLLRFIIGRPFFPIPIGFLALLIIGTVWACRGRVSWGTAIVFLDSEIALLRDQVIIFRIPRRSAIKVQRTKDSLVLRYHEDGLTRFKIIGWEGFSAAVWQDLGDYLEAYVKPSGTPRLAE